MVMSTVDSLQRTVHIGQTGERTMVRIRYNRADLRKVPKRALLIVGVLSLIMGWCCLGVLRAGCAAGRCSVTLGHVISVELGHPAPTEDSPGTWHCATMGDRRCQAPGQPVSAGDLGTDYGDRSPDDYLPRGYPR